MKYVKACTECGRMLRFPLDRGTIKVSCQCGYSFIADPDDTSLYKDGNFDPRPDKKNGGKTFTPFSKNILNSFNSKKIINSLLEIKYRLQNFPILPDSEKFRLISSAVIIILLIFLFFYIILL